MSRKTILMFSLTGVAIVLYLSRFLPGGGLSVNVSDFFGGMAAGLAIAATVTLFAERE